METSRTICAINDNCAFDVAFEDDENKRHLHISNVQYSINLENTIMLIIPIACDLNMVT